MAVCGDHPESIVKYLIILFLVGMDVIKDDSPLFFLYHFKSSIKKVIFRIISQEGGNDVNLQVLIGVIGILVTIIIPLYLFFYRRNVKLLGYYSTIWKKSSTLKPKEVLGLRGEREHGFNEYYYRRGHDGFLKKKIENDENILIIGHPLAGKTRAIYQSLISLEEAYDVIIPKLVDIAPKDFEIPIHFYFWRKRILLLDDIDKFIEKQNFMYLLQQFLKTNTIIIASCRFGPEYDILCNKMERELSSLFGDPIEIYNVSREEGKNIARRTGRELPAAFDGNIGSIFVPLETMRDRFRSSSEEEKVILRAIRCLYFAGIYREREIF